MFSIIVGERREVDKGSRETPRLQKKNPMRGIKFNVYLKEKGYPCFPNAICYSRTSRSEKFKGQIIIDGPWKFFKFRVCE